MANQSITLLPLNKEDSEGVTRSLQTTIARLNQVLGISGTQEVAALSKLEAQDPSPTDTLPGITETVNNTTTAVAELSTALSGINDELTDINNNLKALNDRATFKKLLANDFNSTAWGTARGLFYGSVLGSALSNPPAGVTLNAGSTYQVFIEVSSLGAYWQRLQLIGNSQNRVFQRAGSAFGNAVSNLWKEL